MIYLLISNFTFVLLHLAFATSFNTHYLNVAYVNQSGIITVSLFIYIRVLDVK